MLLALGRTEDALAIVEEVLALAPIIPARFDQLVDVLHRRAARHARALAAGHAGAAPPRKPSEAKALFVQCVRNRRLTFDPAAVLARCCCAPCRSRGIVRPISPFRPSSLVKLDPAIRDACERAAQAWPRRLAVDDLAGRLTAIVDDQLLRTLLETVPVCDVELERC